ncbi:MAG: hypothetical protein KIT72_04580 [Polyangiaceae bacterium]|nr:hypothetical protein [Polyangiaceae bacterium]MCW5789679.1 hypothetical protein [Polyangiaceae bacterium]
MRQLVLVALLALGGLQTIGCGASQSKPAHPANQGPVNPVLVKDADFGPAVHRLLLRGEHSQERYDLLVGVVKKQLSHAKLRFEAGHTDEGVAALTGALYLVRVGELHGEMFRGGEDALRYSADSAARVGDEGRARALYGLLREALPPGEARTQVDEHLKALSSWTGSIQRTGSMHSLKSDHISAANRSLLEPSEQALRAAEEQTARWIGASIQKDIEDMPMEDNADRDEAISVFQAVRTGGFAMAAIYLRHGDAAGALRAIAESDAAKVAPPPLIEALEAADKDKNPDAWAALLEVFARAESPDRPETSMSPELARGAAFGCAVQLYRAEPTSLRGAGTLSTLLLRYGLSEAAPLVLAGALEQEPDARHVSTALGMLLRAIIDLDGIHDLAAARRTFHSADRLLKLAASPALKGKVQPTPGQVQYIMGAIETRAGELSQARGYIEAAVKASPSVEALSTLASIERQAGRHDQALTQLSAIERLAKQASDHAALTRALTSRFEVLMEARREADARSSLEQALRAALDARRLARSNAELSEAERLLARVLEHYGDVDAARRATRRAFDAAGGDTQQITATVLDAARRALTLGDLRAGREALKLALDSDIGDADLVYVALWTQLLERRVKASSDGSSEAALARADASSRWASRLRAWGTQQLDDAALQRAAKSRVEKTEASFYAALSRAEPDTRALEQVAKSETIELIEVTIARDLLLRQGAGTPPPLPAGVRVP